MKLPHKIFVQPANEIEVDTETQLRIVKEWCTYQPKVVYTMLTQIEKGVRVYCPFPDSCSKFPCKTMYCRADTCSNGHAYRMS